MKNLKIIITIVVIVLIVGVIFLFTANHKSAIQTKVVIHPTQIPVVSPVESPTPTAVQPTASSKYSEEFKAAVRKDFINSCNTRGHYEIAVCTCIADYLKKNYSETEIAQMYIQYHTSGQISGAIKTSVNICSGK